MLNHLIALNNLPRKQKGLTTVEYAIAGGVIVAAVVTGFIALGGNVNTIIQAIVTALPGT